MASRLPRKITNIAVAVSRIKSIQGSISSREKIIWILREKEVFVTEEMKVGEIAARLGYHQR